MSSNTHNNATVLVTEFESQKAAHSAATLLVKAGFDMADVSVHGASWLDHADPDGEMTVAQSATMGAAVAGVSSCLLGLMVGLFFYGINIGAGGHQSISDVVIPLVSLVIVGTTLGVLVGAGFGAISIKMSMPHWVEPEYGQELREGNFLLLVHASEEHLDVAKNKLAVAAPKSVRIMPAA